MIYLDSSVALAHLFDERRRPDPDFWQQAIRSSRLLEYEVWNRLHASGRATAASAETRKMMSGVELVDLSPGILSRALQPFPVPVRTLDGLHLATMDYLRLRGASLELASYDDRLISAAQAMGFGILSS